MKKKSSVIRSLQNRIYGSHIYSFEAKPIFVTMEWSNDNFYNLMITILEASASLRSVQMTSEQCKYKKSAINATLIFTTEDRGKRDKKKHGSQIFRLFQTSQIFYLFLWWGKTKKMDANESLFTPASHTHTHINFPFSNFKWVSHADPHQNRFSWEAV